MMKNTTFNEPRNPDVRINAELVVIDKDLIFVQ